MSFWSFVRADVASSDPQREGELVKWWANKHQPQYLAMPGFRNARLLETLDHENSFGWVGQKYTAVYEIDSIDHFNRALESGPPWDQWEADLGTWIIGWTRTYRRLLSYQVADHEPGAHWVIVKSDLDLSGARAEEELRDWYDEKHIPEFLAEPGFHRAWRFELVSHPQTLGVPRYRFWAAYEVDSPEVFDEARARRTNRGIEPWDGRWTDQLRDWGISYHKILNSIGSDTDPTPLVSAQRKAQDAAS